MTDMPEKPDRSRLLLLLLAVVVGLAVASIPLMASIFSEPSTPPAAAPSSTGVEPADNSATGDQTAPAENRVTVDNVVPCVEPKGEELASENQNALLADGAELADVHLPCLTDGGEQSNQSLAEQFAGTPTVVNVWAWWCGPCRDELPVIEEFAARHPEMTVVGVHADRDAGRGAALLEDLGVDIPSFQDDRGAAAAAWSLPGVVPVTVVLRDGEVERILPQPFDSVEALEEAVR